MPGIRTLRGQEDAEAFGRSTDCFSRNGELAASCTESLSRLTDEDAYGLQRLIFDTPAKVRYFAWVYPLTLLAVATLLAAPFYPLSLLLFMAIFAVNLYIHYSNKLNVSLYGSAVKQLSHGIAHSPGTGCRRGCPARRRPHGQIRQVAEVERRSRVVGTQGDVRKRAGRHRMAFHSSWPKIAFNIEVILFQRFIGSITARRDAIHGVFRFIGETDAAISVARLRSETQTCRPQFVDGKYLEGRAGRTSAHRRLRAQYARPRRHGAAAHRLQHVGQDDLHPHAGAQRPDGRDPRHTASPAPYTAPYMRLLSSIRISDDIAEGTSYYLQEVLTVKRFLEASQDSVPCLFALDELFKGTNTTERIAAGKAVLAHLNRGPHIVLVSTHDIELAELLDSDGYELHHFREEVVDGRLVFDYQLHTGPLTTRNAIRILELYDYPPELIAEAYAVQERLLKKPE